MKSSDYREILRAEFKRRKLTNERYSLRAFAQDLELSPAFISKLLNGQKDLSLDNAVSIARHLGFNKTEAKHFCELVQWSKLRNPKAQATYSNWTEAENQSEAYVLNLDLFQMISDWYHYAILELIECYSYEISDRLISKKLGISILEAKQALRRLQGLHLIEQKHGRWYKKKAAVGTPTDIPSQALRNFHSQMIHKAQYAIQNQPTHLRDISGLTIAISKDKIDLAKRNIQSFRKKMAKLLDSSHPSLVYQLNIQFFSLTENSKEDIL